MRCIISNCAQSDIRNLFKCNGSCGQYFHAACIGVQRNSEEKLLDYMLPLCLECQSTVTEELDLKLLINQQKALYRIIHTHMESSHAVVKSLKSCEVVYDTLDAISTAIANLETTLKEIKRQTSINTTSIAELSTLHKNINIAGPYNNMQNDICARLAESFRRIDEKMSCQHNDTLNTIAELKNDPPNNASTHIAEELAATANLNCTPLAATDRRTDELKRASANSNIAHMTQPIPQPAAQPPKPVSSSGWRVLGNSIHWKPDWTEFDKKMANRKKQERLSDKARRKEKLIRRRKLNRNADRKDNKNTKRNISDRNNNEQTTNQTSMQSDKELLKTAKILFSHPPPDPSPPNFIAFEKGETIQPYRGNPPTPQDWTDPMRPPAVRLTQESIIGDGRYARARLRDPRIMNIVRIYLAYLHDQPATTCLEGTTPTSAKIYLASEGLPTAYNGLIKLFVETHEELGITKDTAMQDLSAYKNFLRNQHIQRIQQNKDSMDKFYGMAKTNFRK